MWVFGYGSLVWKVDFTYECKIVGYIRGYLRRFYQHSIDHRGTPTKGSEPRGVRGVGLAKSEIKSNEINGDELDILIYTFTDFNKVSMTKPGRVVTLLPSTDKDSKVWGVAYKIRTEDIAQVTKHLDFREKNGYTKQTVTFHPKDGNHKPFSLTLYVATEENESYAGPAPLEDIAKQIISCEGPSGTNKEYVYNLAKAMRQLAPGVRDEHLFALEAAIQRLDPDFKNS